MKKHTILTAFLFLTQILRLSAQQSLDITFNHDGKIVYGTLTKPNANGKFPVVIIGPGSGANDRNGTIAMVGGNITCLYPDLLNDTLYPYKQLAEALTLAGYAVLRYDKLEFTYSSNIGTITFHKLCLPVLSAIDYLKTRNDIDSNNIILIGHSESSYLIPHIAAQKTNIKALISIGGPHKSFDSLFAYQLSYFTALCGGDTATANAQAAQILQYFQIVRTKSWNNSTPSFAGVSAPVWFDYCAVTDSVVQKFNKIKTPTLFVNCQKDVNVPINEFNAFKKEITNGADFYSLPNLIHYMNPINQPLISKNLTDTIIYWLQKSVPTTISRVTQNAIENLSLYPNPAKSEFNLTVKCLKNIGASKVFLLNPIGQRILVNEINLLNGEQNILINLNNIPNIAKGVYACILETPQQITFVGNLAID